MAVELPLDFDVTGRRAGGVTRLSVRGSLGIESAFRLEEAVESELLAGCSVVIDLSRLAFMDSIGLRVLIRLQREHPEVSLARDVSPQAWRTIDLAALERELRWAPAAAQA